MTIAFPDQHVCGAPYGQLAENLCREELSIAYAHAVSAAARCTLEYVRVDHETVDATIRQKARHFSYDHSQIDLQLKSTGQDVVRENHVSWRLNREHYDSLRSTRRSSNVILVVMIVPKDLTEWVDQDDDALRLSHCAYWESLKSWPEIDADSTTIQLSRRKVFNVEQLLQIMARVGAGEDP